MKIGAYILVLGFLSAFLSGCDIQGRLLYYPGKISIDEVRRYAMENGLQMWPEQDSAYQAIVNARGPMNLRGTIVVFHGNAGTAASRRYYIDALNSRGYRVVLAEYPGYGGRTGELSEESFIADARRTAIRAKEEFGGPLYLWGESMGCGVASALAKDPELDPRGIVMLTPWDSLLNEGKALFPWLPVRLFMKDTYDNVANLSGYKGPVAVIMSGKDEVIPNRLTERLYESLPQPKRLWVFKDSGHNDWPVNPQLEWWDEVMAFLGTQR